MESNGTPAASSAAHARRLRATVYDVVEGHGNTLASRIFDDVLVALILLSILAFALETVPSIEAEYGFWFDVFEAVSVAVFSAEYAARLWTAVELPYLRQLSPLRARLRLARTPAMIIDLMAVLPFYLGSALGLDLRVLRVFRLLRFLKLSRYSPAMHTLARVLYNERKSLVGAGLLLFGALLIASTGMYYLEHKAQPDKFGSVPEAAYWAMTTLTTVGYGDVVPVTTLGRIFAMVTMLGGLCVLALPVAIISTGFAQEVGRRDFVVTWSLMSRIPLLAELDAAQAAELMPLLHAHTYPPGVVIDAAGTPGEAMYFLAAGQVAAEPATAATLFRTGDFFGAVAMIEDGSMSSRFVTRSKCKLLKIYKSDFQRLETISPVVVEHIRRVARARRQSRQATEAA